MSNAGLFAVGAVVALLVAASLALLFWAAVLDGRYEHEHQEAESDALEARRRDAGRHVVDAA